MLNTFVGFLRSLNGQSEFETYYANLQSHTLTGSPTMEEARREYLSMVARQSKFSGTTI